MMAEPNPFHGSFECPALEIGFPRVRLQSEMFAPMTLKTLLGKASPARSGDELAGLGAGSAQERVAAQMELAGTPLNRLLNEPLIPYEIDGVTRLILDSHVPEAGGFSRETQPGEHLESAALHHKTLKLPPCQKDR